MRNEKIKVNKANLIAEIKKNKENHKKEYAEAVVAYRKEAAEQLEKQQEKLKGGDLDLGFYLVVPEDKTKDYDKLIAMFEWELEENVLLTQAEFNQYVMDETDFAMAARGSNTRYSMKSK